MIKSYYVLFILAVFVIYSLINYQVIDRSRIIRVRDEENKV
ncbi:MAG: hypothetical protein WC300_04820 [Candidatus Omnitrophota bacterium]